jgi:hypothetical protein
MNDQDHSLSLSDPDRSLVLSHFLTNFLQNLASCHTALRVILPPAVKDESPCINFSFSSYSFLLWDTENVYRYLYSYIYFLTLFYIIYLILWNGLQNIKKPKFWGYSKVLFLYTECRRTASPEKK